MTEFVSGHVAEEYLPVALSKLGVLICSRPQVLDGRDPGSYLALARATPHEDWEEGTDFWYYVRRTMHWYRIDLTIATNPDVLAKKFYNARLRGVTVVRVNWRTLELASSGCQKDLVVVNTIFLQVTKDLIRQYVTQRGG